MTKFFLLAMLLPLALLADTPASSPTSAPTRTIIGTSSITVIGPIFFDEGSDALSVNTTTALDIIAQTLLDNPSITLVEVQGHADPLTEKKTAKAVANRRAKAAASYLISKGVSPKRIKAKGYAASKPLSTTEPVSNRRVEVHIKKTKS
jgi:OOP family OmpA-OmpF porin